MVPIFSSFAAIGHKGHFRKILTGFSSLAAFICTTPTFLKKISLITWIDKHQFQIPKMKKQKTRMSFSSYHFSFWDQYKAFFPFFPDRFGQLGNFFQVGLKQKNLQKNYLLINLVPSVAFFYIRTKCKLKNRVTTLHILQRKTN